MPERGATMVYQPVPAAPQPTEAASAVELGIESEVAVLSFAGDRVEVTKPRAVVGRSKDGDIQVEDPNVSRRHAELRREGAAYWLVDLDSTNGIEVRGQARQAPEARGRHPLHDRLDGDHLLAGDAVTGGGTVVASAQVETTLLVLKIAFLVLLYLFIWRIVRSASRDLRLPQESMILSPATRPPLVPKPVTATSSGASSSSRAPPSRTGDVYEIDSPPLTVGRGTNNDLPLDGDEYASGRHARFESRRDGVYIEDIGSTNGTFVNGIRLTRERRLAPGDVVRIGETDLRFES